MFHSQHIFDEQSLAGKLARFVMGLLFASTVFMAGYIVGHSTDIRVSSANRLFKITAARAAAAGRRRRGR
jgi:hypothetical protein